jgi:hypothetical protein
MTSSRPIELDQTHSYQRVSMSAVYRALCETHGETFAEYFIDEYKSEVQSAARTRLCGNNEAWLLEEITRLKQSDSSYADPTHGLDL